MIKAIGRWTDLSFHSLRLTAYEKSCNSWHQIDLLQLLPENDQVTILSKMIVNLISSTLVWNLRWFPLLCTCCMLYLIGVVYPPMGEILTFLYSICQHAHPMFQISPSALPADIFMSFMISPFLYPPICSHAAKSYW